MKIIFLDIDGVLKEDKQGSPFLGKSFDLLKSVVDATGAKLVMSSSWKVKYKDFVDSGYRTDNADILGLYKELSRHGLTVYDYTPLIRTEHTLRRPEEIREYLKSADGVEGYCIIDDRSEFAWAELADRLVLTDICLKTDTAAKATAMLLGEN